MAEATAIDMSQVQLNCLICLELMNDPVTTSCGHNYCRDCIGRHWDTNANVQVRAQYNCPECRQTFPRRPVLGRNVLLADLLETVKRTNLQSAPVPHVQAGPGDVQCHVCTGRKYKAIKSCLVCQKSLCQRHFQQHERDFKGESHCSIDVEQLQEMICPPPGVSELDQLLWALHHSAIHDVSQAAERGMQNVAGIRTTREPRSFNTSDVRNNATTSSSYSVPPNPPSFDAVSRTGYARRSFFQKFMKQTTDVLLSEVMVVSGWVIRCKFPTDGPTNRSQFLQYSHKLSMDSNTVNETLVLSGGNREATNASSVQLYAEHPDRFDCWPQVLCKERVWGRAYWEFEWSGRAGVGVSLAYKRICRKGNGDKSKFGSNDRSMILHCSPSKYRFWYKNKKTKLDVNLSKVKTCRLAVYVDHSAGLVLFFSISDKMKLIHIVQTRFTHPVYPGFRVYSGSSVKLCDPAVNFTRF